MKYIIHNADDGKFGEERFPILFQKVTSLCTGSFGDFEYPYFHNVLVAEWFDEENDCYHYEIIGEFERCKEKKEFFFKKTDEIVLFNFKSKYIRSDVEWLIAYK